MSDKKHNVTTFMQHYGGSLGKESAYRFNSHMMVNSFSPKVSRPFNEERTVCSSNHAGTSGCPHVSQVTLRKLPQDGPKMQI